jgi:ubiquinone/menaquinone biosynthesis C-methylase UbiE
MMHKYFIYFVFLAVSIAQASQRPSIFSMPGVERPPVSETLQNNACYQKLMSVNSNGKVYGEQVYENLVQFIHAKTNLPIETITNYYSTQYPGKSPLDIVVELTHYDHCFHPDNIKEKFRGVVKEKLGVELNGDSITDWHAQFLGLGYVNRRGDQSESNLSMVMSDNPEINRPEKSVFLSHNLYYVQHTPYVDNIKFGYTPELYFSEPGSSRNWFEYLISTFYHQSYNDFRSKNHDLVERSDQENVRAIESRLSSYVIQLSDSYKIPFSMLVSLNQNTALKQAEDYGWDLSKLRSSQAASNSSEKGYYAAHHMCGPGENQRECGSIVVDEEPIHAAYHDYLNEKQGLTIVDLGSSIGFNSIRYTDDNSVLLCDRSIGALSIAAAYMFNYHPDKIRNLSLTMKSADELILPENSVDVVFMGYLIKYFPGDKIDQMLAHIFKYLKPGGKLFLAELDDKNGFYDAITVYRDAVLEHFQYNGYEPGSKEFYYVPFPKKSQNWSGEKGALYVSRYDLKTYKYTSYFQYNLTRVTHGEVIAGLKRAGFQIESDLTF